LSDIEKFNNIVLGIQNQSKSPAKKKRSMLPWPV
jgi:hypothetical protein